MVEMPNFSPCEVEAFCPRGEQCVTEDGWTVWWDGPQFSPPELWGPIVEKGEVTLFASGGVGDPITQKTVWVAV